jgi:hypothetical protein
MEEKCCNCGKMHKQDGFPAWKNKELFEGKTYEWAFCSIECTLGYKGDEILEEINDKKAEKLKTYLEGQKLRLDHPKFKL